ncbi:MAG: hypothetical protein QM528_04430 [Phycisphaerales bacterium]|nr:hypothetical protein [Phycisphaerales bacterium]
MIKLSGVLSLLVFIYLRWHLSSLNKILGPLSIVNIQLARTQIKVNEMLRLVGGTVPLKVHCYVSFLFIILYTYFLIGCCSFVMKFQQNKFVKKTGYIFLELITLTAVLDMCSTILLLVTLSKYGSQLTITMTYWVALFKYLFFSIDSVYICIALVIYYIRKHTYVSQ